MSRGYLIAQCAVTYAVPGAVDATAIVVEGA